MTMGIKIVNAIEQKEKAHYTHLYSGCVLSFISIYLNLAIGSSKYNFMIF